MSATRQQADGGVKEALHEEPAPCFTYWKKGHPISKYDFNVMLTETTYHDKPAETRNKYTEIGAQTISRLLRKCNVPDDEGQLIMETIGFFYSVPTMLCQLSETINLIGKASDDVRNKRLQQDEVVLRLLFRLRCERTERKIDEDEKAWIKMFAKDNMSISSVSRICERSKASVSDIMNGVSHAYSKQVE